MIDIVFIDGTDEMSRNTYPTFLGYLFPCASVLEQKDFSFKILNLSLYDTMTDVVGALKENNVKVIGITTTADNYYNVRVITHYLKKECPQIPIILGGPQASFNDTEVLKECSCDVIIRHEGDYKLVQLLDFYIHGVGSLDSIKGISFVRDHEFVRNVDSEYLDINELPTPQYAILTDRKYWILPNDKPETVLSIFFKHILAGNSVFISSRGCPYNCIFCVEGSRKRSYRERKIDKVIDDLEYFLKITKVSILTIADSTFTSSSKRIKDFCNAIKVLRKKYHFNWYAEGRVNILAKNPELIDIMHDAGLVSLQVGIESGSDKILKIQNKNITLEQVRIVAQKVATYNDLELSGNFILGNPGETDETFKETVEFAKELHILSNFNYHVSFGYLVPYVGTPIREMPEKFGIEFLYNSFENEKLAGYSFPLCKPDGISLEKLHNLFILMHQELATFYVNNIFKLQKKDFDEKVLFYIKIFNAYPPSFNYIFKRFDSLKRYYQYFEHDDIIKDLEILKSNKDIYPVRLWDLQIDENRKWFYCNLRRETIKLTDDEYLLWQLASGLNTIKEIFEYIKEDNKELSIESIIDFYKKLYNDYCLLFKY